MISNIFADKTKPMFSISATAEMTGLHQQTIRSYEQRGLIQPYRTPGGTRMYSMNDVETLTLISDMSASGVGIEGIHQIIEMQKQLDQIVEECKQLRAENQQLREIILREHILSQMYFSTRPMLMSPFTITATATTIPAQKEDQEEKD
jgi:MerR family transcriptional regulator/heat shock protein HspR